MHRALDMENPAGLPAEIKKPPQRKLGRKKGVIAYMVKYSKQAQKFLAKQEQKARQRLEAAIQELPSGDVKKLKGQPYYRLRVGDFRVIFDRDGSVILVV